MKFYKHETGQKQNCFHLADKQWMGVPIFLTNLSLKCIVIKKNLF